jgi:hypothetical protein
MILQTNSVICPHQSYHDVLGWVNFVDIFGHTSDDINFGGQAGDDANGIGEKNMLLFEISVVDGVSAQRRRVWRDLPKILRRESFHRIGSDDWILTPHRRRSSLAVHRLHPVLAWTQSISLPSDYGGGGVNWDLATCS